MHVNMQKRGEIHLAFAMSKNRRNPDFDTNALPAKTIVFMRV